MAEPGNRRTELTLADVNQAISDLGSWFESKANAYFSANMKNGGASDAQMPPNCPEHLQALLKKYNGGMHFMDTYKGLSADEIKSSDVGASLIAFAKDIDGSLLCINRDSGNVCSWDAEDKAVSEDLKMNLGAYLEDIRNRLLSNKLGYEEEVGLYSMQ